MSVRFVDPGYGDHWLVVGNTGTISCVESEEYNPYCGVAFTGLKSQGAEFCALTFNGTVVMYTSTSATNPYSRSSYCLRFSVYLDLQGSDYFCVGFNADNNSTEKTHYIKFDTDGYTIVYLNADGALFERRFDGPTKGFHNVALGLRTLTKSTSESPYHRVLDFLIDNTSYTPTSSSTSAANITNLNKYIFLHFCSERANACYVSNVILTYNSELTNKEPNTYLDREVKPENLLVRLPLKDTTGDFITGENGEYIGNTAGQQLLSTIDAQGVIEKFGATSKVSHLVSFGSPGYRTDSNITVAHGLFEVGGEIVDGTNYNLLAASDATIFSTKEMTQTTLADVDGKKIGWRV